MMLLFYIKEMLMKGRRWRQTYLSSLQYSQAAASLYYSMPSNHLCNSFATLWEHNCF